MTDINSSEKYQVLDPLTEDEYDLLRADIVMHGVKKPIDIDEYGEILDGHHRYKICQELDISPPTRVIEGLSEDEKIEYARSVNFARRHQTPEAVRAERVKRVAELRAQGMSLRAIADEVGVSDMQVHKDFQVQTGFAPENVTGSDDKTYPATKPTPEELDERRERVAALRAEGHTYAQIAEDVGVSIGTVAADVREISRKPVINLPKPPTGDELRTHRQQLKRLRKETPALYKRVAAGDMPLDRATARPVHVAQNSGNNEWYTPPHIIEAAVQTMGGIDLDPASSAAAAPGVGATRYYTADDDGLAHEWAGRVWLNPPYARGLVDQFAQKLIDEIDAGRVTEACVLVNNATDTAWFQLLACRASAVCLLAGRVNFLDEDGNPSGKPLQGQVVLYFNVLVDNTRFWRAFDEMGVVYVPI